jgi:sarcosine oxidase
MAWIDAVIRETNGSFVPPSADTFLRPTARVIAMKTCLFSNTQDEHFVLDLHPGHPEVSIAAGFSGHGFKFCSVVGEIMADLALEGGCKRFDLGLFRFQRLLGARDVR